MKQWIIALLLLVSLEASATLTNQTVQGISAYGNNSTTNYTISFPFQDNDQIKVYLQEDSTTPASRTEIYYGSGSGKYTITGGDPGTTVVMGTAPTTTQKVVIRRDSALTQTVDLDDASAFPFEDFEEQMDKTTQSLQEMRNDVDNKVGISSLSTASTPVIPDPDADKFLVYNHAETDLTTAPNTTPVSGDFIKFNGSSWDTYNISNIETLIGASALGGSGDQVLTFKPDGSNMEFDFIVDSNIAGVANIERGKLAKSTASTFVYNLPDGVMGASSILHPNNGGTGKSSLTAGYALLGGGLEPVTLLDPGTNGNIMTSNGTSWYSAVPGASSFFYSGYHANNCVWNSSSTSFATPSAVTSCTFDQVAKSGFSTVSSANNGTPGSNLPGVFFTPDGSSGYKVCAYMDIAANGVATCGFKLTDGTKDLGHVSANVTSSIWPSVALCGVVWPQNTTPLSVYLQLLASANTCSIVTSVSETTRVINWTLERL